MISGCPTALSEAEVKVLQYYARGKRVVEAGALLGYSTIKLAEVASHVVSIDRHEGYSGSTLRRYLSNLERAGIRHKVTPLVGNALSTSVSRGLLACVKDVQFGFIDLTGDFPTTYRALRDCQMNIIGVHDFRQHNCKGVEAAIQCNQLRIIEVVDTLAICSRF